MLITVLTLLKWSSFILIHLVNTTIILAQPDFLYHSCRDASNSYTPNSMYKQNLDTTLDGLSKTDSGLGFFNLSTGQGNDRVYSVALCRGDVHPDVCRSCLKDSVDELPSICPDQKEALGYYDRCILKYSDQTILQPTGTKFNYYSNNQKTSDDQFNEALKALLADLTQKAAVGGPLRKYAAGNRSGPGSTIYAHVQCFPDMSEAECNDCLENLINWMSGANINRKAGGVLISTKCDFRYDTYKFFNDTTDDDIVNPPPPQQQSPPQVSRPPPLPQQKTSPPPGKKNNTTRVVTIVVVVVAVIVAIIIAALCIFSRLRKKKKPTPPPVQYDFSTIKEATNDFSEEKKLGQGRLGAVYKGTLRDGQEIAVKRLARDSGQGDVEFKNEVLLVAKLQHRNLVRLLGFSMEGSERLLIYEFLPNASLDHFIFDLTKRELLDWGKRYNIIKGIANGLLYLHEDSCPGIIHGDMKASNVLLDVEKNPKIADFGMVRLCKLEETQGDPSQIVRTCGYMAPEYAMKGQFSVKLDVFSFGVLVLEMVTGQKNQCSPSGDSNENLLSLAWKSWKNGMASNMMDPLLASGSGSSSLRDIDNSIHIGLLCVQENNTDRPTMADVVQMLNCFPIEPRMPSEPAFFMAANVVQMHISSPITPSSTPSKPTTFARSNTDPEMPLLPETGRSDLEESKISNSGPSSSQTPGNDVEIDDIVI